MGGARRQPSPPQHTHAAIIPSFVKIDQNMLEYVIRHPKINILRTWISKNHHPKDMDPQKTSKSMDLGPETSFWTSGKCNPEQNVLPDPFLTSILAPDGLTDIILMNLGPRSRDFGTRQYGGPGDQSLVIYIYIYIYIYV